MSSGEISGRQKVNESMLGKETGKGSCSPEHAMGRCKAGKSPAGARALKGQGCGIYRLSGGQKRSGRRQGVTADAGQEACLFVG